MKKLERFWGVLFVAAVLLALGFCAQTVLTVDPYFHYHDPDPEAEVWFDSRGQSAGLLRTQEHETVLMGTSLMANYRAEWFDTLYDTSTVKVTFPSGGFGEFTTALGYAYDTGQVDRVIFGLDPNLLARDHDTEPSELLKCLYDQSSASNVNYLLNKDVLMRCAYVRRMRAAGETEPLRDAFLWDGHNYFSREIALASYVRPEKAAEPMAPDALLENCRTNLAVVTIWAQLHPDTQFILVFPPYSVLYWDRLDRLGETEAMLTLLEEATATLLTYDNVELQWFMNDFPVIEDLDNYADHIHAAGKVTYAMAEAMPGGAYRMDGSNREALLRELRDFVTGYDYDALFAD